MIRYATVSGARVLPFRQGRGLCPTCCSPVIAKCGEIKTHHWAHEAADDCDPWSEGIGPWHISWQDMAQPDYVEVPIRPHRADILADNDVVVELQHSSISPERIAQREAFYGSRGGGMVWLFDATERFHGIRLGDRYFFSFGRTRHVERCRKGVLLDFGGFLVEVEAMMAKVLDKFSGFGRVRDREWFAGTYLATRRNPHPVAPVVERNDSGARPWGATPPWMYTSHPSRWMDPDGRSVTYPTGEPYLPLDYRWCKGAEECPAWAKVIGNCPSIANGWGEAELRSMKGFLQGTPMILGGCLRLMPAPADRIQVAETVRGVMDLLARVDGHIRAGRVPVMKRETKELILSKAKAYEIRMDGSLGSFPKPKGSVQKGLFQ